MDNIGSYLKEKREALGLSIDDISHETRLKDYIIKQIESNDFEAIGDTGFIKIMVVTYCRAVKGDEDLVLKALLKMINKPLEPPIKINTAKKRKKPIFLSLGMLYFVLLSFLIIFLTFFVIKFYKAGSMSFKAIREQLAFSDKKERVERVANQEDVDSLWVKHRAIFYEKNNLNDDAKPVSRNVVIDTSKKEIQPVIPQRKINKSERLVLSSFDYVNHLVFNDKESPLNIDIFMLSEKRKIENE